MQKQSDALLINQDQQETANLEEFSSLTPWKRKMGKNANDLFALYPLGCFWVHDDTWS